MAIEVIEQFRERADGDLAQVGDGAALEAYRIKYLGSKGELKGLMGQLKTVPADQRAAFGKEANALRQHLEAGFAAKKDAVSGAGDAGDGGAGGAGGANAKGKSGKKAGADAKGGGKAKGDVGGGIDITEPGLAKRMGSAHVITQTIDELVDVFGRMGFDLATGPEVEDDHHNFVALNIPATHPARDPLDNFYLNDPDGEHPTLLRSQTSTVQIRVMENTEPPIRVVSMGRVYRPDEHDATHYSMFHQIEGLYVDKNVTMVDLKTTLLNFAHAYWGPSADVKLVPSYFPFTEPSAEVYVKMELASGVQWVEVGGCGMVDPAVFEAVGYDPEVWSGFAFGLGIERLLMRKYSIADIRWLFENDVRFLRRFG